MVKKQDRILHLQSPRRFAAIIGVDGSGKSSVIEGLQQSLPETVTGVYVVQGARQAKADGPIQNHARAPRPFLISALKVICRAVHWTWKYHSHYRPLMDQGHLVLCDRFYFDDVHIDPRKYRYGGPLWLLRALRRLVPAPDLYIMLDAPEEVLYARKQETTIEEVGRLRRAYQKLIGNHHRGFFVNASEPLGEVIHNVRQVLMGHFDGTTALD